MNRRSLMVIAIIFSSLTCFSQTLFTYGKYSVSSAEFLRAYHKNNSQPVGNKQKAMQDYLDLYINSRLKIREAYERGYDTLPQIRSEVENLRNQIMENYVSDPTILNFLISEAFTRSQKDIHVGHIFISLPVGDTLNSYNKAKAVYDQLKKGEDFYAVAGHSSQDPGVGTNKGDIGWITVFTLPYIFENAIYNLGPGGISAPILSKSGYHIFKNLGERKALGKMKAKDILLAFPPTADDTQKKKLALKADSIYKRLLAGESFEKMAQAVSNDYVTAVSGGTMPDFGIGQFEPAFESKVWALAKDGAITRPFMTSHGYHIVKRVAIVPVPKDTTDKVYEQELKQRIIQDQRLRLSNDVVFDRVVKKAGLRKASYSNDIIWALSDSLLDGQPAGIGRAINRESVLFTLGDTSFRVNDWITFAQAFRYKRDGSGRKAYTDLMDEYIHSVANQYYRQHLETFNDEFRYQMNEFRDGNLFFEIMQQEIWNKAHTDTTDLKALYETNKEKYRWTKSADAVIFFCSDQVVAKTLYEQLKKNPANWKTLAEALTEKVVADSSRYEWSQLPGQGKFVPTTGLVTAPLVNETDNTASFAYIIKTYPQPMQRTYDEAKGLVINDYQAILEEQWVKKLRVKYPVVVDQKVFAEISK